MNKTITSPRAMSRLSKESMSNTFGRALRHKQLITSEDTALMFYDLDFLDKKVAHLKSIFPDTTLHAIAAKANPLSKVLSRMPTMGVGLEVASLPELYLAERAGFLPETIVFDSPSKTREEIEYALKLGVYINADSFAELDRIGEILKTVRSTSVVGLRINPQVGAGTIRSTSVADSISKFGVPLNDHREKLKNAYLKYDWLRGIHVHIGSQGCPVPLLIEGIRKVVHLANEINDILRAESPSNLIKTFDMGGGLPVSYYAEREVVSIEEYREMLLENCVEFFDGTYKLITEFGRYVHANAGWIASKVEYVKKERNYNILMTHVGADMLLRKAYNPDDWHHEITVVDENGELKSGKKKNNYIVAGPLCFAGDIIATGLELPIVTEGDYLLIHDVGAYTLSMWSRYNSRQIPKIIGVQGEKNIFEIIKDRERKQDLFEFWT